MSTFHLRAAGSVAVKSATDPGKIIAAIKKAIGGAAAINLAGNFSVSRGATKTTMIVGHGHSQLDVAQVDRVVAALKAAGSEFGASYPTKIPQLDAGTDSVETFQSKDGYVYFQGDGSKDGEDYIIEVQIVASIGAVFVFESSF